MNFIESRGGGGGPIELLPLKCSCSFFSSRFLGSMLCWVVLSVALCWLCRVVVCCVVLCFLSRCIMLRCVKLRCKVLVALRCVVLSSVVSGYNYDASCRDVSAVLHCVLCIVC